MHNDVFFFWSWSIERWTTMAKRIRAPTFNSTVNSLIYTIYSVHSHSLAIIYRALSVHVVNFPLWFFFTRCCTVTKHRDFFFRISCKFRGNLFTKWAKKKWRIKHSRHWQIHWASSWLWQTVLVICWAASISKYIDNSFRFKLLYSNGRMLSNGDMNA